MVYDGAAPKALPSACPCHGDGRACDVRRHGLRARKCGPGHALTVVRCRVHALAFTLYPMGWTPYGRAPVESLDASAETMLSPVKEVAMATSLAAVAGHRRTRIRAIELLSLWLGVVGPSHEAVAVALQVDLAAHRARRAAYRGSTWHQRAGLVVEAHTSLEACGRLHRMLVAGYRSGCLGPPWRVDAETGALAPFCPPESSLQPRPPPESEPSTTLSTFGAAEEAVEGQGTG